MGVTAWALGIFTVMSFSSWAFDFTFAGEARSNGPFDILDILTANFMLPLGGLAMAVFAGWFMSRESVRDELEAGEGWIFRVWYGVVRYVTPIAVILVFLRGVGLLSVG